MAKIPTILSSSGIRTATGPQATPGAFAPDISSLAQAAGAVANSADSIAKLRHQDQLRLQEIDQVRRLNEVESHLRRLSVEFSEDPKNLASEDSPRAWDEVMGKTVEKIKQDGGFTPESAARFDSLASDIRDSTYAKLYGHVAGMKLQKAAVSIVENHNMGLRLNSPGEHAVAFEQAIDQVSSILKSNPSAASKLKADLQRDMVLSFLSKDLSAAESALNRYTFVDEPTRESLNRAIERQREQGARELQYEHSVFEKATLETLETPGNFPVKPPEELSQEAYHRIYGKTEGSRRYSAFRRMWDGIFNANKFWEGIEGKPPSEQAFALSNLKMGAQGETDSLSVDNETISVTMDVLRERVAESSRILNQDGGVAWLRKYDPAIKERWEQIYRDSQSELTEPSPETYADFNRTLIDRQRTLLGIPNPSLLTLDESKHWAAMINSEKNPDKVIDIVTSLSKRFPDNEQLSIALHDLKSLPEGQRVGGAYQLMIQNQGQYWLPQYALAQVNYDANLDKLKSLSDSESSSEKALDREVTKALKSWASFGVYRQDQEADAREAVKIYAAHLAMTERGLDFEEASEKSVRLLLGSTLVPVKINDQTLLFPKGDKELEAGYVSDVLNDYLGVLDTDKLHPDTYLGVVPFTTKEDRDSAIRDTIANHAWFDLSSDGRSLQLVMMGADGIPRTVMDRDGAHLYVDVEEVRSEATQDMSWPLMARGQQKVQRFLRGTKIRRPKKGNWNVRP